ncbi:MAG: helix-turn-helix transcriptional regulator [Chitinophagales bacterium]|nr:helix-turn-helix transcriptional regulator [Chitinophagales bacterium]
MNRKGLVSRIKSKIIEKMSQRGLTQTTLAQKIDTSQQALNKLLNQSDDISISKMEKIAEALDIKFNELLPLNINQNNNDGSKENYQTININEKDVLNQILENQKLLIELTKQVIERDSLRK